MLKKKRHDQTIWHLLMGHPVLFLVLAIFLLSSCRSVHPGSLSKSGMLTILSEEQPQKSVKGYGPLEQQLFEAARHGNISSATDLLSDGAYVDVLNEFGESIYEVALKEEQDIFVRFLVAYNTPLIGGDALAMTIKLDRADLLTELISVGDPNAFCRDGSTPLVVAIHGGDPEMVKILLNNGAKKGFETQYGTTPIMAAAEKKNTIGLPDAEYNYIRIEAILNSHQDTTEEPKEKADE